MKVNLFRVHIFIMKMHLKLYMIKHFLIISFSIKNIEDLLVMEI